MKTQYLIALLMAVIVFVPLTNSCGRRHKAQPPAAVVKEDAEYVAKPLEYASAASVLNDVHYVPDSKLFSHTMDVYLPKAGKAPYPIVLWIHGGSWMHGDKRVAFEPSALLDKGIAVASMNYRLSGFAPFPAQLEDCRAALRYLRAHWKELKIDPNRIGLWGSSAGGHLAALVGTIGDTPAFETTRGDKLSCRVSAVCDWCGPTNLVSIKTQCPPSNAIAFQGQGSPVYIFMNGKEDDASLKAASPVTYITPDDPPFLIMHGTADNCIPVQQSVELHESLKKAGVKSELITLEGQGHNFSNPDTLRQVADFFQAQFSKSGS